MAIQDTKVICDTCGKERTHPNASVYGLPEGWLTKEDKQFCGLPCATISRPLTAKAATIIVAASNSSPQSKALADYVCDGVDDQDTIALAFTEAAAIDGKVVFLEGTFYCSGSVFPMCSFQGMGRGTIFSFSTGRLHIRYSNVTGRDVLITGTPQSFGVAVWPSLGNIENILLENIVAKDITTATPSPGFRIYPWLGNTVKHVTLINCVAEHLSDGGFAITGEAGTDVAEDINLIGCRAIECGDGTASAWSVGFLVESITAKSVNFIGCYAEKSWESGFHVEAGNAKYITFVDCVSRSNGQKPSASFGCGFTVGADAQEVKLIGCVSELNLFGYRFSGTTTKVSCERCSDEGATYDGFYTTGPTGVGGFLEIIDCITKNAGRYGIYVPYSADSPARNIKTRNLMLWEPVGTATGHSLIYAKNSEFDLHVVQITGGHQLYVGSCDNVILSGRFYHDVASNALWLADNDRFFLQDFDIKLPAGGYGVRVYGASQYVEIKRGTIRGDPTLTCGIFDESTALKARIDRDTVRVLNWTGYDFRTCNFTTNSGTATVANATTSIVVTHGLVDTPTRVFLMARLWSNASKAWITNLTTTQFTINVDADPGAGTAIFDWKAQLGEL